MSRISRLLLSSTLLAFWSIEAVGADCRSALDNFSNNSLAFFDGTKWQKTDKLKASSLKKVWIAYFIKGKRANFDQLLVIKTGRTTDSKVEADKTRLVRNKLFAIDSTKCRLLYPRLAFTGSVSNKSYDRYHDHLQDDIESAQDGEKLKRNFHAIYLTEDGDCIASDDSGPGAGKKSSRSQFSFNPSVVDGGAFSNSRTAKLYRSSVAKMFGSSTSEVTNRKAELLSITTDKNGNACIQRRLNVQYFDVFRVVNLTTKRPNRFLDEARK